MNPIQQTIGQGAGPKAASSKRVQNACLRCHKQKLKCDNERPCALCVRSSMECIENVPRTRTQSRTMKSKVKDHPLPNARHPSQSSPSGLPSPAPLGRSEQGYEERPSTYPLVNHMFEKYNSVSGVQSKADAIPDGSPSQGAFPNDVGRVPVLELIGMDLPSRVTTNLLLDCYLKHIHWFIMVIHEPTLRRELDDVLVYGTIQPARLSFLTLILVILAFGSNYTTDDDTRLLDPKFDRYATEKVLIRKVEENFLNICDSRDIELVQTGLILSSYYVYFGKPKRASIVYDVTLTSAKAIGLHRESLLLGVDPLTKEIRRRVWWAVYAGDGFCAVNFGRPCSIDDTDWEVKMVSNMDDTSITCPGFHSTETLEDGSVERVTILSYRRCKYRLYQIVSAILKSVYFTKDTGITVEVTAKRVEVIHERLLAWERTIPPELTLASFEPKDKVGRRGHILETFKLQALALHVFYNNIQLLLHRPLLTYNGLSRAAGLSTRPTSDESSRTTSGAATPVPTFESQQCQLSRNQSWESAIQTSKIIEYRSLLFAARNTPVAHYIGIQAFTAGAVLGLFALSAPLTNVSLEAKRALGKLIKMPQNSEFHSLVSDQCGDILKELVHLILAEETRFLTSDLGGAVKEKVTGSSSNYITNSSELVQSSTEDPRLGGQYDNMSPNHSEPHAFINPNSSTPSLDIVERGNFAYCQDTLPFQANFPATPGALLSLQNVFSDDRMRQIGQHQFSNDDPNSMMRSTASTSTFNTEMGFDDTSQTWIWGDNFDFR